MQLNLFFIPLVLIILNLMSLPAYAKSSKPVKHAIKLLTKLKKHQIRRRLDSTKSQFYPADFLYNDNTHIDHLQSRAPNVQPNFKEPFPINSKVSSLNSLNKIISKPDQIEVKSPHQIEVKSPHQIEVKSPHQIDDSHIIDQPNNLYHPSNNLAVVPGQKYSDNIFYESPQMQYLPKVNLLENFIFDGMGGNPGYQLHRSQMSPIFKPNAKNIGNVANVPCCLNCLISDIVCMFNCRICV